MPPLIDIQHPGLVQRLCRDNIEGATFVDGDLFRQTIFETFLKNEVLTCFDASSLHSFTKYGIFTEW
jgi:hypothetical protein